MKRIGRKKCYIYSENINLMLKLKPIPTVVPIEPLDVEADTAALRSAMKG